MPSGRPRAVGMSRNNKPARSLLSTFREPDDDNDGDNIINPVRAGSQFPPCYGIRSPPRAKPKRSTQSPPSGDDPLSNSEAPSVFISRHARRVLRTTPVPDSTADGSEGRDEFTHIDDFDSSKRRRTLTPPDRQCGKTDPIGYGIDAQHILTNRLSRAGGFSLNKESDSSFGPQEGTALTTYSAQSDPKPFTASWQGTAKQFAAPKAETAKPAPKTGTGARSTTTAGSGAPSKATSEGITWMGSLSPISSPEDKAQKPSVNRKKAVGAPPSSWKTGEEKRGKKAITTFHKRPLYGGPRKPEEKLPLKVVAPNAKESKFEPVQSSYIGQWTAKGKGDRLKSRGVQSQVLEDNYDDDEDGGFVNPIGRYKNTVNPLKPTRLRTTGSDSGEDTNPYFSSSQASEASRGAKDRKRLKAVESVDLTTPLCSQSKPGFLDGLDSSSSTPSDSEYNSRRLTPSLTPEVDRGTCDLCGDTLPLGFLDRWTGGDQDRHIMLSEWADICTEHKLASMKQEWSDNGYPSIDWKGLKKRVHANQKHLEGIILDKTPSPFREEYAKQQKETRGNAVLLLKKDHQLQYPGYYGPRGANIMLHEMMPMFGALVAERGRVDSLLRTGSASSFIQTVLVPELGVRFIMEDMGVSEGRARLILEQSRKIGETLNLKEHSSDLYEEDDKGWVDVDSLKH